MFIVKLDRSDQSADIQANLCLCQPYIISLDKRGI